MMNDKPKKESLLGFRNKFIEKHSTTAIETDYFIFKGKIKNQAYNKESEPIRILKKDGSVEDVAQASDQLSLKALSKPVTKYFICYPKELIVA